MVHNEPFFLPIWLRYYSRFFAAEDIYVLDNDSTDGSTDRDGFVRIPVSHDRVDHTWMVRTIEELQHELLERYDVVLVTDVDEIVIAHPRAGRPGRVHRPLRRRLRQVRRLRDPPPDRPRGSI